MRALSLSEANKFRKLAARLGVSKVARSSRGFMAALKRYGSVSKLPPKWKKKRAAFIKRHMAQVRKRREKLFKGGSPTRRHLALIMWAASPSRSLFRRTRKNPRKYSAKAKYIHRDMKFKYKNCDKRSIRTIRIGKHGKMLRICCPKGKWMPRKNRCKVGTKAFEMLVPKSGLLRSVERRARTAAANPPVRMRREGSLLAFYSGADKGGEVKVGYATKDRGGFAVYMSGGLQGYVNTVTQAIRLVEERLVRTGG